MKAITTTKHKLKIGKRVKNTLEGKQSGNVPAARETIWLTISASTGDAYWDYTRQGVRNFIKKKGSEHFISPRKATLQPEYTN